MSYKKHLSKDIKLKSIIRRLGDIDLRKEEQVLYLLCCSIMSQQLSTKVASVIRKRFLDLFEGTIPDAQQIVQMQFHHLRSIGLSNAKARYIQNVALFDLEHGISFSLLDKMKNEEVIEYLTRIKGVGRWTAEMLLMFTLGREDVFALDDLGIRQAIIRLYGLRTKDKKKLDARLKKIAAAWSPYRTYACVYLWRWKDGEKKK